MDFSRVYSPWQVALQDVLTRNFILYENTHGKRVVPSAEELDTMST